MLQSTHYYSCLVFTEEDWEKSNKQFNGKSDQTSHVIDSKPERLPLLL